MARATAVVVFQVTQILTHAVLAADATNVRTIAAAGEEFLLLAHATVGRPELLHLQDRIANLVTLNWTRAATLILGCMATSFPAV